MTLSVYEENQVSIITEESTQPPKENLPLFVFLLAPFVILICSGAPYIAGWNVLTKVTGAVLVICFIIRSISTGIRPTAEAAAYGLWTLWALTGFVVAKYPEIYLSAWLTLPQIAILIFMFSDSVDSKQSLAVIAIAFLIGGGIAGGYSIATGEFQRAEIVEERLESTLGANGFGFLMLLCTIMLAYLWMIRLPLNKLKLALVLAGLYIAAVFTIISGSRKAVLSIVLFYVLWGWFCYRRVLLRRPITLLLCLIMFAIIGAVLINYASHTGIVERFQTTWDELTGFKTASGGGIETRRNLAYDALGMAIKHPIAGIGLKQVFLYTGSGLMSHVDIIEVVASTGFVGLGLYAAIYIILWRRTGRILLMTEDLTTLRIARLTRAAMLTILAISLGRTNYDTKELWVLLAAFIGWSHHTYKRLLLSGFNSDNDAYE